MDDAPDRGEPKEVNVNTSFNKRQHPIRLAIAALALGAGSLTGCGSSDGGSGATTSTEAPTSTEAASSTDASTGGDDELAAPTATLPEIDEALQPAWKPVDAVGEPLPEYDKDAATDPAVGKQLPVLTGYDIDGNVIRIDPASQGKTMIVALAHWCPHCNNEVPVLNDLQANSALPSDLNVVAVLTGSRPDRPNWPPVDWIKSLDWNYPAMVDGLTNVDIDGKTEIVPVSMWYYGFGGFPTVLLVDANGTVVRRWSGEAKYNDIIARVDEGLYKQK